MIAKRALDLLCAIPLLIILSPILLILAIIVWLVLSSPVIFRTWRAGLQARPFILYKFRTMKNAQDPEGHLLPDGERLTRFGQFLRKLSLDELPELFNVLQGDMSLVGPRPLPMEYLGRYTPEQRRRHEVKPGITGWAQVNGRNAISWEDKFRYDVWYVDHRNLLLDFKIVMLTIWKVVKGEGINQPGHVTMEEFRGEGNI
jgi:sugar transferase EpsL